jgi:hypothetical protein
MKKTTLFSMVSLGAIGLASAVFADGIVSTIVNAPLSATGTVKGTRVGINVYLQNDAAQGADFMDPNVIGYGIPAGGTLEVEMGGDYERDWDIGLGQPSIMLVTGAPQQGLPGKAVGYTVEGGDDPNVYIFTATGDGMDAATLMSPSPGAKGDPVRQRGIKVIHIGFRKSAFLNAGDNGTVTVRFKDASGNVMSEGTESIAFLDSPQPQILPTNFPNKTRNHNWQVVSAGSMMGNDEGTLPLTYMLYGMSTGTDGESNYAFKGGMDGVGILPMAHMMGMGLMMPDGLERFKDGLLVQDSNGDGKLDPAVDTVVGGISISAPDGATGYSMQGVSMGGMGGMSVATEMMAPKPGKLWGGSMLQAGFTAGDKAGKYRATATLLKVPGDVTSGDGSSYTYTIVVK